MWVRDIPRKYNERDVVNWLYNKSNKIKMWGISLPWDIYQDRQRHCALIVLEKEGMAEWLICKSEQFGPGEVDGIIVNTQIKRARKPIETQSESEENAHAE